MQPMVSPVVQRKPPLCNVVRRYTRTGVGTLSSCLTLLLVECDMRGKRVKKCYLCHHKTTKIQMDQDKPDGHGSTHHSLRADDDLPPTEATPLVRFPEPHQPTWRARTSLAFGFLMTLLVLGTAISVYLLYLQNQSTNILPPVKVHLALISREQWCDRPDRQSATTQPLPTTPYSHIIVVQTNTVTCYHLLACAELLRGLQVDCGDPLPYNFLVSSNGVTYEGLGWDVRSDIFPQLSAMVVAFIGSFTEEDPTTLQLQQALMLFDMSNIEGRLTRNFTIVGKIMHPGHVPIKLFKSLRNLTRWDEVLSDDY